MALLLFIRSIDDVMPAVEAASKFLAYQQRHLEGSRQPDDLLTIWIDPDLDAALPAWSDPSATRARSCPRSGQMDCDTKSELPPPPLAILQLSRTGYA